jgi:hypothetical protein
LSSFVRRLVLGDVEVAAEGAADEVALGGVFFVGASLECAPELRVKPDRHDFGGADAESWPAADRGGLVAVFGFVGELVDQLVGDGDAAACSLPLRAHGRRLV